MSEEKLISVDSDIENQLTVSDVERDGNCYFRCISLAIHDNENKHEEVRMKIVETMKMNRQVYQAYAENFDSHLENMMRSDGHTNTLATEAEILATSEAYKCDVLVLREQYINIGWQKFSFDKECNHNKKSIKILNTANHFKLVTDEKRVCICVERPKIGKSVILNDGKTTRNPNSEQISEEGIVHGTLNEQKENLIGNYRENTQEKEPRHTPVQSGKNAADPAETIETIYNKIVYFKHHNMFTPSQGTTTEMMTREMTRIIEEYNNDTSGKAMAMKLLIIMPKLLLQKEHMKAKKKENDEAFRRRMEAWQKGEFLELMEEAEPIQKRLCQQPMVETERMTARKFRKKKCKKEMCIRQQDYYNPNKEDYFRLTKRPQKN